MAEPQPDDEAGASSPTKKTVKKVVKKKVKRIVKKRKDGTIISSEIVDDSALPNAATGPGSSSKRRSKSLDTRARTSTPTTTATPKTANKSKVVDAGADSASPSTPKRTSSSPSLTKQKSIPRKLPAAPLSPAANASPVTPKQKAISTPNNNTNNRINQPNTTPSTSMSKTPSFSKSPTKTPTTTSTTPQLPAAPELASEARVSSPSKQPTAPSTPDARSKTVPYHKQNKNRSTSLVKPTVAAATLSPAKKATEPSSETSTTQEEAPPKKKKPNPYQPGVSVYMPSKDYSWMPATVVEYDSKEKSATLKVCSNVNEAVIGVENYAKDKSLLNYNPENPENNGNSNSQPAKPTFSTITIKNASAATLPLPNLDKTAQSIVVVDDMVDLAFLHEAAILFNLKARHVQGQPYTRTGDIVIAVNPYQWMNDLYTQEQQTLYARQLVWQMQASGSTGATTALDEDSARRTVAPHVYEVSALAYRGLARTGQAQSILVSGESGAGKTETVKICMNHMALVQGSGGGDAAASSSNSNAMNPVVERVVQSNPLLEVFGNAKTRRNDNSSRFGKYVQLQFDRDDSQDHVKDEEEEDPVAVAAAKSPKSPRRKIRAKVYGQSAVNEKKEAEQQKLKQEQKPKKKAKPLPSCELVGSLSEVYLLEKSRVVSHHPSERTFHIFYALLAASDKDKQTIWKGLIGKSNPDFQYVGATDWQEWDGIPDSQHYAKTRDSLALIGITGSKLQQLMQAIVIVLQCGQIVFEQTTEAGEEHCVVPPEHQHEFQGLSELTGVSAEHLQQAFTTKTMSTRGETFTVPLAPEGAKDSCDAFAKEVYSKAFLWLVREINAATSAQENYKKERKGNGGFGIIGLLDIFGFESFPVNGFDQLCINYANEKLQAKFTKDIFKSVEAEYIQEGIPLKDIKYDDNSDVLELIESRSGLLALLEQECVRPKGTAREFVYKVRNEHRNKSPCLIADKHNSKVLSPVEFGVHHYAGKVIYYTEGFLQRNQDAIAQDLYKMALESSNEILSKHLKNESMTKDGNGSGVKAASADANDGKRGPRSGRTPVMSKSGTVIDTVWNKFRGQLNSLMSSLSETKSRYIRCIKPNSHKKPLLMQHDGTVEQLRCAGVVAAVTITRSAFPSRLDQKACLDRFQVIFRPIKPFKPRPKNFDMKVELEKILGQALADFEKAEQDEDNEAYVVGKTRVYFRAGVLEHLEQKRVNCWDLWACDIQRTYRAFLVRKVTRAIRLAKFHEMFKDQGHRAIPIQSRWRVIMAKKEIKKIKYDKLHGFASSLERLSSRDGKQLRSPQRKVGKLKINPLWS